MTTTRGKRRKARRIEWHGSHDHREVLGSPVRYKNGDELHMFEDGCQFYDAASQRQQPPRKRAARKK